MSARVLKGPTTTFKKEKRGLGQLFFEQAEKHGNKICQIDAITGRRETFASVKKRSTLAAIHLRKLGIKSEDVILFCSKNSLDITIPVIGTFYLGAKVSSVDPSQSVKDCAHGINLVSPKLIITEEDSVGLIEDSLLEAKTTVDIIVIGNSQKYRVFSELQVPSPEENDFRPEKVDCHKAAIIYFSSGTTGLPKGINATSFGLVNGILAVTELNNIKTDVMMHVSSLYWISASLIMTLTFLFGGARVLVPKFEPELFLQFIERYKVTYGFLAPVLAHSISALGNPDKYDTSSLYTLILSGTLISREQMIKTRNFFKHSNVTDAYGCTEANGFVTVFDYTRDKEFLPSKLASCGKCLPDGEIKVVNIESRKLLPPNQKGEICIKSPYMMPGYHNMNSLNCFDEDGFIKTGDIVYYDDDEFIYVVDRIKEMFKYRSWHVVPSFLEKILQEHPAVKEVVVFGIPHEIDEYRPAACIVLKDNAKASLEEIEQFFSKQVSDWHKLRGGIKILDSIPRSVTGKIQRRKVRDVFLNS